MAEQRPDRPGRKVPRQPGTPNGGMRVGRGLFGWVLFIGLAIMLVMLLNMNKNKVTRIPISEFEKALETGTQVQSVTIEGNEATGEFTEPLPITAKGNSHFTVKLSTDGPVTYEGI